jgi:hypothetical protein
MKLEPHAVTGAIIKTAIGIQTDRALESIAA